MQLEKMKNFIFSKGVDKVNTLIPWRGGFFMEGPGGGSRMFAYPGGLNRPKRLNAAPDGLCQSICLLRGQLDQTHRIFRQKHLYTEFAQRIGEPAFGGDEPRLVVVGAVVNSEHLQPV